MIEEKAVNLAGDAETTDDAGSFEAEIAQLEQIIQSLEQKELPLDEALKLFQAGIHRVQHCTRLLDQAEKQMEILLENEDGSLQVEPARLMPEG